MGIKPILLGVGLDLALDGSEVRIVEIVLWLVETLGLFLFGFEFGAFGEVLVDAVVIAQIGLEGTGLF